MKMVHMTENIMTMQFEINYLTWVCKVVSFNSQLALIYAAWRKFVSKLYFKIELQIYWLHQKIQFKSLFLKDFFDLFKYQGKLELSHKIYK